MLLTLVIILLKLTGLIIVSLFIRCIFVLIRFAFDSRLQAITSSSFLYVGRVKHSRLKGGAIHHLDYPLFFAYIDLEQIQRIKWKLWPIFQLDRGWTVFSSLNYCDHLKDSASRDTTLLEKVRKFAASNTESVPSEQDANTGQLDEKVPMKSGVTLLTHLTYFGYCFNPVSFYFIFREGTPDSTTTTTTTGISGVHTIVTEVSNTPWNEQHSYVLNAHAKQPVDWTVDEKQQKIIASWSKEFHVSPFMEMDYRYTFSFSEPGLPQITVAARMVKQSTQEVWFTASFLLERIPFTPLNLLYVLVFYPLHTRMIQIWIHIEAVKIFFKGVPTFEHPQGTDVDFGLGITGKKLCYLIMLISQPFNSVLALLDNIFGLKPAAKQSHPDLHHSTPTTATTSRMKEE